MSSRALAWLTIFALAAIASIVGAIIQCIRHRKLKTIMAHLGFSPASTADDLFCALLEFRFFRKGQQQYYTSIHKAALKGLEVVAFDYAWDRTGEEEMVRQSVIGFRAPDLALPFLARDGHGGLSYQCKGDLIFFFSEGRLVTPQRYEAFMTRCLVMLEQIRRDPPQPIRTSVNLSKEPAPQKRARRRVKGE